MPQFHFRSLEMNNHAIFIGYFPLESLATACNLYGTDFSRRTYLCQRDVNISDLMLKFYYVELFLKQYPECEKYLNKFIKEKAHLSFLDQLDIDQEPIDELLIELNRYKERREKENPPVLAIGDEKLLNLEVDNLPSDTKSTAGRMQIIRFALAYLQLIQRSPNNLRDHFKKIKILAHLQKCAQQLDPNDSLFKLLQNGCIAHYTSYTDEKLTRIQITAEGIQQNIENFLGYIKQIKDEKYTETYKTEKLERVKVLPHQEQLTKTNAIKSSNEQYQIEEEKNHAISSIIYLAENIDTFINAVEETTIVVNVILKEPDSSPLQKHLLTALGENVLEKKSHSVKSAGTQQQACMENVDREQVIVQKLLNILEKKYNVLKETLTAYQKWIEKIGGIDELAKFMPMPEHPKVAQLKAAGNKIKLFLINYPTFNKIKLVDAAPFVAQLTQKSLANLSAFVMPVAKRPDQKRCGAGFIQTSLDLMGGLLSLAMTLAIGPASKQISAPKLL